MSDDTPLPRSRLGRLARLARVSARSGTQMLLDRDGDGAAKKAADALGQLRGLATKVGQMASYVDGVVPEQHRGAYEKWMKGLQSAAPRSSPAEIRALVEDQLGEPIDQLFAEWTDTPVASASIGQVHRARLPDGRAVAVKVQHPGIIAAMNSDLRNAGLVEGTLARMAGMRKFNSREVLDEIRARFREELDYALEARRQHAFAALFDGDPRVRIPAVIDGRCAERVLTTTWAEGVDFDAACAAPEPERADWCRTLWRFVYKSNLVGGLFNADPHPGNYFFQPDGRVVFVDFGCVQPLSEERRRRATALHLAAHARDHDAFHAAARAMLHLRGGPYEPRALAYLEACFRPLFESPHRMTRSFVVELVESMKSLILDFRKGDDDGYVPLPDGMFFINRLQFGFYSLIARLDAEVDYVAVEKQFLPESV